ncbi:MAG: class I SAM-dependent methyltransferase [Elusimicrobia bacterium]|nr:class I SAM-dependent methyltransferase [Elusimicrobiota bacterium]
MKVQSEWHKKFFKNSFYNPASSVSVKRAGDEVDFVVKTLNLKKGSEILDLCCGPGRHSILLAKRGFSVAGLDFSNDYISEAKKKARKARLKINFIKGDMRNFRFKNKFDAVINMFTSFGYFKKFSDDIKVLKEVCKSLKPRGLFLIDTLNGDWLRKNFRSRRWQKLLNGVYQLEETELAKDKKSAINRWIRIKPDGKIQERIFYLRLYDKKLMSSVLKKAGLTPLKFWGNFKGQKLSGKSNRLIALARKK